MVEKAIMIEEKVLIFLGDSEQILGRMTKENRQGLLIPSLRHPPCIEHVKIAALLSVSRSHGLILLNSAVL